MQIERAGISDVDALVELRLAYLSEDHGHLDEADVEVITRDLPGYFHEHLDKDLFAYVARNDQAIVSCALLLVVSKPMSPSFINGRTGTVFNVYTRPESRRRGCARKVMSALLADAQAMGLSVVDLKATEDGYPLYQSLGFVDDTSPYRPMTWRPAIPDRLIAYCGVDCSSCPDYRNGKCPSCRRSTWAEGDACMPVSCCNERSITTCGFCDLFPCDSMAEFYDESDSHREAYHRMRALKERLG